MSATDALDAYLQASGAHARPSARRCSASGGSQPCENRRSAGAVLSGSAAVRKQAGRGSAAPSQRTQPAAANMLTRPAGACVSLAKQRARAAADRPALAPEQARGGGPWPRRAGRRHGSCTQRRARPRHAGRAASRRAGAGRQPCCAGNARTPHAPRGCRAHTSGRRRRPCRAGRTRRL